MTKLGRGGTARRWLVRAAATLAACCAAVAVVAAVTFALAIERTPRVARRIDIGPADVERALAFARAHDPRRAAPNRLSVAYVPQRDADLLLHQALNRLLAGQTRVTLEAGAARVQASVPLHALLPRLSPWPVDGWVNVELRLVQQPGGLPAVDGLRLGRLPLPSSLALPALRRLAAWRGAAPEALALADVVRSVQFMPGHLVVSYRYGSDGRERVLAAVLPPPLRERMRGYAALLAQRGEGGAASVSLAELLPPLFALAAQRSAGGADAALENRAAILALALYCNRRALDAFMPGTVEGVPPETLTVTLQGRDDFPRHLLVSALIAAEAGTPLADAVGLWKELDDARRGSGFSFNDIAADRAGTRLGELAVAAPQRLQARLARPLAESDLMPATADLPEFLPEAEFKARYGGVGAPAYQRIVETIEARVAALPVLSP